jgi:hypothetical protein
METYTDEEREYHTDIINDIIDFVEKRKPSYEIPFEEHADLILSYSSQVDSLHATDDIVDKEEYITLCQQSEILVRQLANEYTKTSQINMEYYYRFCKIVEQMLTIIVRDTDSRENDISDMFTKMKM